MKKLLLSFFVFHFSVNISHAANIENSSNNILLQIKNHKFIPKIIEVPSGKKFNLIVENLDNVIEEFESRDLNKEKIIPAKKKIVLIISPLKKGEYSFFGDFHPSEARGKIIAK